MTQEEYLKKLKRALRFRYNRDEADEIMEEYRSFFDDGLREGRTEDALCESFGSPNEVVRALREEYKPPHVSVFLRNRLIACGGFLLLFFIWSWLSVTVRLPNGYWESSIELVMVLISMVLLWFVLGGGLQALPPYDYKKKPRGWLFLPHGFVSLTTAAVFFYHFFTFSGVWDHGRFPPISQFMPVIYSYIAIMTVLLLWGVYGFLRLRPEYYTFVCHSFGGLFTALFIYILYGNLDDPSMLPILLLFGFAPYLIGIAAALAFAFFIRYLRRKEARPWMPK